MSALPAAASPVSALRDQYVVVQVRAVEMAIPIACAIQAVPRPADMAILPRRAGALCGVMSYRDQYVPVIDLTRWVDMGGAGAHQAAHARSEHGERIMVLQEDTRVIGVLVQAVRGVFTIPATSVQRVHHDDAPEEVFHSVGRIEESGAVVSLLDASRLLQLAAVWAQAGELSGELSSDDAQRADAFAGDQRHGASSAAGSGEKYAVVTIGSTRIAVPAVDVGEVLAMPPVQSFGASTVEGLSRWRDRHIPVISLTSVLRQPAASEPPRLMMVICRDGLALGVPAHALRDIQRFDVTAVAQTPHADASPVLRATVIDDDGSPLHVIDTQALISLFPETAISSLDQRNETGAQAEQGSNEQAYIVFDAGSTVSSPIDALQEVLPMPAGLLQEISHLGCAGSMEWRGQAIDVVDLRVAHGSRAATSADDQAECDKARKGYVMVARNHNRLVGFIVDNIRALIPPRMGTLSRVAFGGKQAFEMITTGQAGDRVSYRILDLAATGATAAVAAAAA